MSTKKMCWNLGILIFIIFTANADNTHSDWPTYVHPDNETQLCYLCPAGFHLVKYCAISDAETPSYSTCEKCEEGLSTESWNKDTECKKRIKCSSILITFEDEQKDQCCCPKGMIEDNGNCVSGISEREADQLISQKSCTCPSVIEQNTERKLEYWHLITAFLAGVVVNFFICGILLCCYRARFKKDCLGKKKHHPSTDTTATATEEICSKYNLNLHEGPVNKFVPCMTRTEDGDSGLSVCSSGSVNSFNRRIVPRNQFPISLDSGENSSPTNCYEPMLQRTCVYDICNQSATRGNSLPSRFPGYPITIDQDLHIAVSAKDIRLDNACRIMEKRVLRDPTSFNRQVLHLSIEDCHRIENNDSSVSAKIRSGFLRWKQKNGSAANMHCLIKLLREGERNDVADEIETSFDTFDTSSSIDSLYAENQLDIAIELCEKHLEIEDALPFFRVQLGLEDAGVFEAGNCHSFIRDGFATWKSKKERNATVMNLLGCLEKAGLMELNEKICEKLNLDFPAMQTGIGEVLSTSSRDESSERLVMPDDETDPKSHYHNAGRLLNESTPIISSYTSA